MKKILATFAIVAIFASCNSNPKTNTSTSTAGNMMVPVDTTGLAEFQKYKAMREQDRLIETSGVYDEAMGYNNFSGAGQANGFNYGYAENNSRPVVVRTVPARSSSSTGTRVSRSRSSGSGTVAQTRVPARKKGWSSAAKGTAIGAGSGAVLGAIISKKKGKGAIIGGIIGAAGGYVLGRAKDKRDGRY